MEGLIDASDGWIDGSVSVCLFPDDWEHGTALHCTACSATVPHARARFPNSPTISSTLQKLNAPLIPFLITASCQRRTTTTTKTTTTTTPTTPRRPPRRRTTHTPPPSSSLALLCCYTSPLLVHKTKLPKRPSSLSLSLSLSLSICCRLFSMPSFFFFFSPCLL